MSTSNYINIFGGQNTILFHLKTSLSWSRHIIYQIKIVKKDGKLTYNEDISEVSDIPTVMQPDLQVEETSRTPAKKVSIQKQCKEKIYRNKIFGKAQNKYDTSTI